MGSTEPRMLAERATERVRRPGAALLVVGLAQGLVALVVGLLPGIVSGLFVLGGAGTGWTVVIAGAVGMVAGLANVIAGLMVAWAGASLMRLAPKRRIYTLVLLALPIALVGATALVVLVPCAGLVVAVVGPALTMAAAVWALVTLSDPVVDAALGG